MIFHRDNLFCQPTPSLLDATASLIEWSADNGATWQTGTAPVVTAILLRVTAPAGVDVSGAAWINVIPGTDESLGTLVDGQVVSSPTELTLSAAGIYAVQIAAADDSLIFDAGTLTFA